MWSTAKRRIRKTLAILLAPVLPIMGTRLRGLATRLVNPKGKLYIPAALGVSGFFAALEARNARHVVLRWFEELPHIEKGHDLDILVADDAVGQVRELLSTWPLGQKIDIYSETGRNGTGYRPDVLKDVPAFPIGVANILLTTVERREGGWLVPAPRPHFLGLAYHAVYLKGHDAGLPAHEGVPPRRTGSRDYAAVLTGLAGQAGQKIVQPVTMRSLDEMLAAEGWRPGAEHLATLARANPWIDERC